MKIYPATIPANSVVRGDLDTATVTSLAGTLVNTGVKVNITLNAYAFFPMIHTTEAGDSKALITGHATDGASPDSPRFALQHYSGTDNSSYDVEYRYINA